MTGMGGEEKFKDLSLIEEKSLIYEGKNIKPVSFYFMIRGWTGRSGY